MLQRMHDDHRFNTTSKLCKDVLDAYVDGIIPLTEKDILIDSLDILCCEVTLTLLSISFLCYRFFSCLQLISVIFKTM